MFVNTESDRKRYNKCLNLKESLIEHSLLKKGIVLVAEEFSYAE